MIKFDKKNKYIEINTCNMEIKTTIDFPRIFINLFWPLLKLFDFIIPKNDRKIVFNSVPDFSDNAYALYKYIESNHSDLYKCVWIVNPNKVYKGASLPKYTYSWYSFEALYHIFTSKYVISTHSNKFIDYLTNNHIHLNLWHGMPLKALGMIETKIKKEVKDRYKWLGRNAYSFATSDFFKLSLLATFEGKYSNVFVTGQPRTDLIFSNENDEIIKNEFKFGNYDKVIFYMPTYKEAQNARVKQIKTQYENIFYFGDYSQKEFADYLEKNNILFMMKPHPFDENFYLENLETLPKTDNFRLVLNKDFLENKIYSYEIFKFVDLMITDFSSVTIDYLILNRPVIYLNNLADEYNEIRGMILPDNTGMLMPGVKVANFESLLKELQNNLYGDIYKDEREKVLPLLHKYCDSNSCERIFNLMREL